ncbi:MAG: sensor histidine kinase [Halobaculum sp.]
MTEGVLDDYTTPALLVSPTDGGHTVESANEAFRTRGDTDPAGESLATVGERWLDGTDGTGLRAAVEEGADRPVGFADDDGQYLPRVVRETNEGRHLLFVELPDRADHSEAVAHVVSHDLRNPLDVAKAHLRASRDERDDDHLAAVDRAHDRMEEIIRDVLTLARGESAISPTPGVDLDRVVTDAWDGVATDGERLAIDGSLPVTTADRPRVERLVENLLRNAVDHAGEEPTVHAGSLADDAGFYVADDGDGVPSDRREAVFEPGYTASDSGTGLGLAIVERIATAHGWDVRLTESRHGGARVEVRFEGES